MVFGILVVSPHDLAESSGLAATDQRQERVLHCMPLAQKNIRIQNPKYSY